MLTIDANPAAAAGEAPLPNQEAEKAKTPFYHSLMAVAAVLVIVCQLAAMAIVASSQVQKAEQRDALLKPGSAVAAKPAGTGLLPSIHHESASLVSTPQPAFLAAASP